MTDIVQTPALPGQRRSALSAVVVGTITALGFMVMFSLLGLSIGLASLDSTGEGLGMGSAIYLVVTQLISLGVGGFTAARMMEPVDMITAGLGGAAVWALTTLIVAIGGLSAGTTVISSSTSLVERTAATTADAAQAIAPDDLSLPDLSEVAGSVSFANLPPELQRTLEDADITPAQLRTEAREAFRNVISQQEMARARAILTATLSNIARQPQNLSQELNQALDQLLIGENAVLSQEDVTEARNVLQSRLDLTDEEADQLVASVQTQFDEAVMTLRTTSEELGDQLIAAMENVQSTVSSSAFWLFIASLLGLLAAAGAGAVGRRV